MCAISGIIGLSLEDASVQRLLDTMRRRGPDDSDWIRCKDAVLLHTRLAVIDPDRGRQPMVLSWNGEIYTIVYNGELYNAEEMRKTLLAVGHSFCSHSDTEVLLHAYAEYGEKCLEQCNGIYAFAVWEEKAHRLFLARDRIGVKPLFYMHHGESLLFASEIKTLLSFPGVRARLDETGAAQLILLGPGRLPGSGVLKDIREIEPGCFGYYSCGRLTIHRYWKLLDREHRDSFEETVAYTRYLVEDAIQRQMVSDVPIGTFLSGGLDSSIITAVCAKKMAERGRRLNTFSVDYQNNSIHFRPDKFQPNSDNEYIELMAYTMGTEHHRTMLSAQELADTLEAATEARDLPGMADVDFSLLAFCGRIRKYVTVALSGECADEIFGGYPWYTDPEVRAREGFPWAQNTAERMELLLPDVASTVQGFTMDAYNAACRESDILPGNSETDRRMKEMVNLNFRYFMQTLLDRKDRMSMYHGLEVRVPFCDYRIAEYLYAVPWEYKHYRGMEKGLLRRAVEGLLPEKVLYRKKSPYPKTFDPRYEALISSRLERIFEDKSSPVWHLVQRERVRDLLAMEQRWPWYGQLMRRPQTMAYFCQLDFWLRKYSVEFCF